MNRLIVGAHYGMKDWLVQRISGAVMVVYSIMLAVVLMTGMPMSYTVWKSVFASGWMRIATLLFVVSLAWHAWIGARDILMDYIKHDGLRLALQVLTVLLLAGYVAWAIEILWR